MALNYKNLLEEYRAAPAKASAWLRESILQKKIRLGEFDELGKLFVECFGWSEYAQCKSAVDPKQAHQVFLENAGVTTAAFQNISGQVIFSAILEEYESEEFVFTKLIPEMKSPFLEVEKLAGVTPIGDEALVRKESDAYEVAGVGEDWIHAPSTEDRGMVVPLTREAIFSDRTGVLVERAKNVGKWMGVNVEKRAIDAVIDENGGAKSALLGGHRYHWRDNSIATYGDNSGTHTWDNLQATNALVDWTDVEAAELLLAAITDPHTGEPVMIDPTHLIVTPQLVHTAKAIVHATENRLAVGGYATSGNLVTRVSPNTVKPYEILSSRLLAARLGTDTSWFLGAPAKAVMRKVNWPMEVKQAPSGLPEEFHRQIVMQFRANERSAFFVKEPRVMCKSTVA